MEAGLEHLSWAGGTLRHVDRLLVLSHPRPVALLTAARTIHLAGQLGIPDVALVGNRVADGDDEHLRGFAAEHGVELLAAIPEDLTWHRADRTGRCVLDTDPDSAGVQAVERLANLLLTEPR